MFGKILNIENNIITIENVNRSSLSHLMNCHVIFEEAGRKVVGEVILTSDEFIKVMLVGEIKNNIFSSGVIRNPSSNSLIRVINVGELQLMIGTTNERSVLLGTSATYDNYKIYMPVSNFFANHSAIIGNTGSGKSCGVTTILQNLFTTGKEKPVNAHIVLFDAYAEYHDAFTDLASEGLNSKNYSLGNPLDNQLLFPAYFLDEDDLAIMLDISSANQIHILSETLQLVKIFKSSDPLIFSYKNNIIASCISDILTSGRSSVQIRDQIMAVLTNYYTDTLNLDTIIKSPGYDRTLRQCLHIDDQGKLNAMQILNEFFQNYRKVNLEDLKLPENIVYNLNDIYYALEFALISEGVLNNEEAYNQNNILKVRLHSIINSPNHEIFDVSNYISKDNFVKMFFQDNGKPVQIACVNLNNFDDHFAKTITKLFSRLFFNYTTNLKDRGSFPINIILEEAHRYVQNDNDINILGYNIFDRITKEGRKYGTILLFITQRPSELSTTALSQCSNFIAFRLFYPKDIEIVKSISTNIAPETLEKVKSLTTGTCLTFGVSFKVPLLVRLDLPKHLPKSTSVDIDAVWF